MLPQPCFRNFYYTKQLQLIYKSYFSSYTANSSLHQCCGCQKLSRKAIHQRFRRIHVSRSASAGMSVDSTVNTTTLSDQNKFRWLVGQQIDPTSLIKEDLSQIHVNICKELQSSNKFLESVVQFHFNGRGKAFRPTVALLMANCVNEHIGSAPSAVVTGQCTVAMVAEMMHVASLIHDDIVDMAELRRGLPSTQKAFGQRLAVYAGDYIIATASSVIARLNNTHVIDILSNVLEDLVKGEFMQLGTHEEEEQRFNDYMRKNYRKTGSLIANSCKAVAALAECGGKPQPYGPPDSVADNQLSEVAFSYGRNIGIAFQLVDDLLDFTSTESQLGKPAVADLQLGLATAPVLFAAEEFPELNPMIMRRFDQPGDVVRACELVRKSDGLSKTRFHAEQLVKEAVRSIEMLAPSPYRQALTFMAHHVLTRNK